MTQKVTVKPQRTTGDAQTLNQPVAENVVIDSLGRRLVIEQPDFLTESRIMRALGDAASNQHYVLAYVMPAVMVVEIDGVKVPFPATLAQIEAAISRVGREGMVSVLGHFETQGKATADTQDGSEAEALKNS